MHGNIFTLEQGHATHFRQNKLSNRTQVILELIGKTATLYYEKKNLPILSSHFYLYL